MIHYRDILYHTVCRLLGHTQPVWRPYFEDWGKTIRVESGQCQRCWRVVESRIIHAGGTMDRRAFLISLVAVALAAKDGEKKKKQEPKAPAKPKAPQPGPQPNTIS